MADMCGMVVDDRKWHLHPAFGSGRTNPSGKERFMRELFLHPYFPLVVFVVAASVAILSLLSSLNRDRSLIGILIALLSAVCATLFAPQAFALMNA
jgi:hypothetical protein